jgi:hypothetical protein
MTVDDAYSYRDHAYISQLRRRARRTHHESTVTVATPLDNDRSHEPGLTCDDDAVEDQEKTGNVDEARSLAGRGKWTSEIGTTS